MTDSSTSVASPRARDLGLEFAGRPGVCNALTDVPGVRVGYSTLVSGEGPLVVGEGPVRTGVTAILPRGHEPQPAPVFAGSYALNGNGEMTGTHWIDDAGYFLGPVCITNTHSVGMVHHAVTGWMIRRYAQAFETSHMWAMPVVAETYDGALNDINGRHVREEELDRVAGFLSVLVGADPESSGRADLGAAREDPQLMGDQIRRASCSIRHGPGNGPEAIVSCLMTVCVIV